MDYLSQMAVTDILNCTFKIENNIYSPLNRDINGDGWTKEPKLEDLLGNNL